MSFAERFPALARHVAVLRASWGLQDEADKAKKPWTDHEFLPAALEIMEKPPSPGWRWLMLGLCALVTTALGWSLIGKVDVVATATGKIVPSGNVKLIQPIEIGAVRAIHVKNGQHVRAGQLLIELDPTLAGADEAQAEQGLMTARIDRARNAALIAHLRGNRAGPALPADAPPELAATQAELVRTAIEEYEGERRSLVEQRGEQAATLRAAQAEIAKLRMTLPLVEQQLQARKLLSEQGHFSKLRLLEYEQLRLEHIQNIEVQEANAAKARSAIANLDGQIARLRGTFGKTAATALAEAQQKSGVAQEEVTKSARRKAFQALRAPVSGTVQQLAVATVGGVVQPAQVLMVIVPDAATMAVEAQVLNKDIGFVREGQTVRVKLEAYNFTDYGIVPGIVESISRDAIETPDRAEAGEDRKPKAAQPGLVYAARIRLLKRSIRVAGRDRPLQPGLAVQVEIKTGERRIIQFMLSPIAQTLDEAGRER